MEKEYNVEEIVAIAETFWKTKNPIEDETKWKRFMVNYPIVYRLMTDNDNPLYDSNAFTWFINSLLDNLPRDQIEMNNRHADYYIKTYKSKYRKTKKLKLEIIRDKFLESVMKEYYESLKENAHLKAEALWKIVCDEDFQALTMDDRVNLVNEKYGSFAQDYKLVVMLMIKHNEYDSQVFRNWLNWLDSEKASKDPIVCSTKYEADLKQKLGKLNGLSYEQYQTNLVNRVKENIEIQKKEQIEAEKALQLKRNMAYDEEIKEAELIWHFIHTPSMAVLSPEQRYEETRKLHMAFSTKYPLIFRMMIDQNSYHKNAFRRYLKMMNEKTDATNRNPDKFIELQSWYYAFLFKEMNPRASQKEINARQQHAYGILKEEKDDFMKTYEETKAKADKIEKQMEEQRRKEFIEMIRKRVNEHAKF